MQVFRLLSSKPRSLTKHLYAAFSTAAGDSSTKPPDYTKMNYYEILGVSQKASLKDIKKKYLELAKTYHPDVYKGNDKERFKYIREAFDILKSPEKRKEYDEKISPRQAPKYEGDWTKKGDNEEEMPYEGKDPFAGVSVDEDDPDFEKEYAKFFSKPIEVKPHEVIVQEHIFLEQLSKEERARHEFRQFKNQEAIYRFKYDHQMSYDQMLNENIKILNENAAMTDEVIQHIKEKERKRSEKFVKFVKFLMIMSLIPISYGLWRRKKIYEMMDQDAQAFLRLDEEKEIAEVRKRFIF